MTLAILFSVFILIIVFALIGRATRRPKVRQRETDLRLTYKRFMELYPYSKISYPEYKRLQVRQAYKKAVSSTKIKRLVR